MHNKTIFYKWLFSILLALDLLFILLTPHLIMSGFLFIQEEHTLQAVLISILVVIGYVIYMFYKKETDRNLLELSELKKQRKTLEGRVEDAFRYIGEVNVQIQEIRSLFSDLKKYPENQRDLKYVFDFLANKALSIVDVDWISLKIIDLNNLKTLKSHCVTRGGDGVCQADKEPVLNYDLISREKTLKKVTVIKSDQKNLDLRGVCVLPRKRLTKHQQDFVCAIMNQLELLFIFFSSHYYKNSRLSNGKNGQG